MTSPGDMADINRTLGGVEAAIKSLQEGVTYHQNRSEEGRRRLYEKFEQLADSLNGDMRVVAGTLSALNNRVDGLAARLETVEPVIMEIKAERLRHEGAAAYTKRQWGWMATGAALIGWVAHEAAPYVNSILGRGGGSPPHVP